MTRHTTADRLVALLGIRPIRGGSEDGPRDPWREKIEAELKEYFPGEERRIENAAERFRAQAARLLRPDGSRLYSDQEHEQRAAALLAEYDETGAAVTEEIDRAVAEAQAELVKLEGSDPLDALTEAELARANARRAFVSEDAEALPAHQLAPRVRAVLAGDDKAELVLWARYLARRFEKTAGPERGDLAPLVRDLGERLADPKAREKRKRLERRIEIGQAVEGPDRPGAQRARRPGRGGPRGRSPGAGRAVLEEERAGMLQMVAARF
jgi:hypothetical protein